ncbi:hypothetical protein KFK09_015377 [Dendrobium nobile]|uniref:Uncharacterized protein n=1 Tax=Dendrobium nobile TaxID=94219 RepID=A0A8T3B5Z5_DENNO|nr:hypothetical protein KFK09_015377 [Dendrobium nobile]
MAFGSILAFVRSSLKYYIDIESIRGIFLIIFGVKVAPQSRSNFHEIDEAMTDDKKLP